MRGEDSDSNVSPGDRERDEKNRDRREMAVAGSIGLQFGISIAIGALGGNWLDDRFDTAPWLLIAGVVLGATAGFRDLYRFAKKQNEKNE